MKRYAWIAGLNYIQGDEGWCPVTKQNELVVGICSDSVLKQLVITFELKDANNYGKTIKYYIVGKDHEYAEVE